MTGRSVVHLFGLLTENDFSEQRFADIFITQLTLAVDLEKQTNDHQFSFMMSWLAMCFREVPMDVFHLLSSVRALRCADLDEVFN